MKLRALVIVATAAGLAWLAGSAAASASMADFNPALASRSIVANGPALERYGQLELAKVTLQANGSNTGAGNQMTQLPKEIPAISVTLARKAIAREPMSDGAYSLLALDANARGRQAQALRLFGDAHRLTRRNKLAALELARDAARRQDIEGTLEHFDEVLRTSIDLRPTILQQFALATIDERFRRAMTKLLSSRPDWAADFWRVAPTVPGASRSLGEMRLSLADTKAKFAPEADRALATKLLSEQQFSTADALYRKLAPAAQAANERVRNPQFTTNSILPPVDWDIFSTGDFGSEIVPGSSKLILSAINNPGGAVARQWIVLEPGRYVLSSKVAIAQSSGEEDSLKARLTCMSERIVQDFDLKQGVSSQQFIAPPGGCRNFWLDIVAVPAEGSPGIDAEVDYLSIKPSANKP